MTGEKNTLGAFLRARREIIRPEEVGLPGGGVRRVPGLRRSELAILAGISVEYYLRLEQGRDRNPSLQVLQALARVLQLDETSSDYLMSLAGSKPHRPRAPRAESVPPSIRTLVSALPLPALVEGRFLDVLTVNNLATSLSPRLAVGRNRLRDVFLDPAERALFPDWEAAAAALLAGFRQSIGTDGVDDARTIELVGELTLASPVFGRMWARHDVRERRGASLTVNHPEVGDLALHREKLLITGTDGLMLVIYHPEPGSEAAEKLGLLASMSASASDRR
jgi:transcriptional regulator with XRE-family HTH domain